MSKFAFISIALLTYYLAGMYLSLPLMIMGIAELIALPFLFVLPRMLRKHLSAEFVKQSESTGEGVETPCLIRLHNGGRLPASRCELRFRFSYLHDDRRKTRKLYCSADRGDSETRLLIRSQYCGLIRITADRLRVFDYLSLFSAVDPLDMTMEAAVFPAEQTLRIIMPESAYGVEGISEYTVNRPGEGGDEIRQIREYRTGDSNRRIHWNQSAKTDRLWIKEYERETDVTADLLITPGEDMSVKQLSLFYKLLSALVLGLLENIAAVRVRWYDDEKSAFLEHDITDPDGCREMLLRLYRSDLSVGTDLPPHLFRVTTALELYRENTLIHRFSADNLTTELNETEIVI